MMCPLHLFFMTDSVQVLTPRWRIAAACGADLGGKSWYWSNITPAAYYYYLLHVNQILSTPPLLSFPLYFSLSWPCVLQAVCLWPLPLHATWRNLSLFYCCNKKKSFLYEKDFFTLKCSVSLWVCCTIWSKSRIFRYSLSHWTWARVCSADPTTLNWHQWAKRLSCTKT